MSFRSFNISRLLKRTFSWLALACKCASSWLCTSSRFSSCCPIGWSLSLSDWLWWIFLVWLLIKCLNWIVDPLHRLCKLTALYTHLHIDDKSFFSSDISALLTRVYASCTSSILIAAMIRLNIFMFALGTLHLTLFVETDLRTILHWIAQLLNWFCCWVVNTLILTVWIITDHAVVAQIFIYINEANSTDLALSFYALFDTDDAKLVELGRHRHRASLASR